MSCPRNWCDPDAPFCSLPGLKFDLVAFCTNDSPGGCVLGDDVYLGSKRLNGVTCTEDATGKVTCGSDGTNKTFECPDSCGPPA
jgi:hypothetical protein